MGDIAYASHTWGIQEGAVNSSGPGKHHRVNFSSLSYEGREGGRVQSLPRGNPFLQYLSSTNIMYNARVGVQKAFLR
jgi:hypothetical protein